MFKGPIILVEDDSDDYELFKSALEDLEISNTLLWFSNPIDAMKHLLTMTEQPFFILSDMNLPIQNGMDFKKAIDNDAKLCEKSIPFMFYSTAVNDEVVKKAYKELSIQGFFQKPTRYTDIKIIVKTIVDYWKVCRHPNSTS